MRHVLVKDGIIQNVILYDEAPIDAAQAPYQQALTAYNDVMAIYLAEAREWSDTYNKTNQAIRAWDYEQERLGTTPDRPRPMPYGAPYPSAPANPPTPPIGRYVPEEGYTMAQSDVGEIGDVWPI